MKLTEKERAVLLALAYTSFSVAGGDFGFTDEVVIPSIVKGQQGLASLIGSLSRKTLVTLYPDETVNGTLLGTTQYSLTNAGWDAAGGWESVHDSYELLLQMKRELSS